MSTLKFITCGSVDDGKSTLIGRLLYESKLLYADQERALQLESSAINSDGELDYALLLDGLQAEREQGITIDVAYRYFSTNHRQFIVADTPGHEEYTRNMAVGASNSHLAILLIDVTKGLSLQTKRHLRICQMMGISHYVFAVNKMDLVNYDEKTYDKIVQAVEKLLVQFPKLHHYTVIPISAKKGDNLLTASTQMDWYSGKALLPYLETVEINSNDDTDFIMPIQRVSRPHSNFRGFQGEIVQGKLSEKDTITVLPGNMTAQVNEIYHTNQQVKQAGKGKAITFTLNREIDISRGDVVTTSKHVQIGNSFAVTLLWTDDTPLKEGGQYYFKLGTKEISAIVHKVVHKINIHTGEEEKALMIEKNDLVHCHINTFEEIAYTKFSVLSNLGRFILIDKLTNMTAACGIIEDSLQNIRHLTYHETSVTKSVRASLKGQQPKTIWFTGLSGAGKSTLANMLESYLVHNGKHTMLLDGDNIRFGINKNLGFSSEDRLENIRRISEVAKLMNDAGLIVITSTISPTHAYRELARQIVGVENFIEVYLSTALETCEKRDVKGLYEKARKGLIQNMTGIHAPYEVSTTANITIDTTDKLILESFEELVKALNNFII